MNSVELGINSNVSEDGAAYIFRVSVDIQHEEITHTHTYDHNMKPELKLPCSI
jgi:hypothetical protein